MWAERWSPDLRQGDVVGEVLLPLIGARFSLVGEVASLSPATATRGQQVIIEAKPTLLIIASHDCEFNEDKRNKLLVARIQSVPGNLSDEEHEHLRRSNDVEAVAAEAGARVAGVDNFLLDPIPGVTTDERVANFATLTPLPMKMRQELRALKRAELRHEDRRRFKQKLAFFFGGRGDEDIAEAERVDPYGP